MYSSSCFNVAVMTALASFSTVQALPGTIQVPFVQEASPLSPTYEVKLYLDSTAVLGSDFKLLPKVRDAFDMPTSVDKMNVQFLDTTWRDIYYEGWSPRIRKKEDQKNFELTYTKRYRIYDDDIDGALDFAASEGFNSTTTYKAQVEWGLLRQTLSISREKTYSDSGYSDMDLPNGTDSRKMLAEEVPDEFNNWAGPNWATDQLSRSRIYGPVLATRSIGNWSNFQLYIEVWPILLNNATGSGLEYFTEASFKTDDRATASLKRDELISFLTNKGWFLPADFSKTELIMQSYYRGWAQIVVQKLLGFCFSISWKSLYSGVMRF